MVRGSELGWLTVVARTAMICKKPVMSRRIDRRGGVALQPSGMPSHLFLPLR